jgi:GntR family transcriptional regulator of vanillate catabolism
MSTRTENVIKQLREMLIEGAIRPETHLHEAALAEKMGVSRTPVRDALRVLANENLLNYSPNRGYTVKTFGLQDILDAYDVRGVLEAMACRVCAERGLSATAESTLRGIIERSTALMESAEWDTERQQTWRQLNSDFHFAIANETGNQHLVRIADQMRRQPGSVDPRLEPQNSVFQSIYTFERARQSHAEHGEIVDAIVQRQGARAESLMREHVFRNRELVRRSRALQSDVVTPLSDARKAG